jgi:chromosome segregation ATPase
VRGRQNLKNLPLFQVEPPPATMPSKMFKCDFCDGMTRKCDLPAHIKSKHAVELAKHLVDDAKATSVSVISAYLKGGDMGRIGIPSLLHPDTDYWFFPRPVMIEEKDDVRPLLEVEANREAHSTFIQELMDIVSLNDYLSIQRNLTIRSKEMLEMKSQVKTLEKTLQEVRTQHDKEVSHLQMEVDAYRKTVEEVNDGVLNSDLRLQIETARQAQRIAERHATKALEQLESLQWKYDTLENQSQTTHETNNYRHLEIEEAYIKRIEKLQKDLATTNASLEKEKSKNAKIKARKKKNDRDSQKKRDLLERLRREEEELRAKKKALERGLDSDSDSSSASDSDSE